MNLQDYFEILSTDNQVLHIKICGFWSDDFVNQYGDLFIESFKSAIDRFYGQRFIILTDETDFHVPGDKARKLLVESLRYCQMKNMVLAIDINPTPLGGLGLNRVLKEAEMQDNRVIMKSLTEAHQFIESCRGGLIS